MNAVVVYNSKTGFSERYGKWIAQELSCEALTMKEYQKSNKEYEVIVFGAGLMAGKIAGLDKMKPRCNNKKLIVYATGAMPMQATEQIEKVKAENLIEDEQKNIPFFYLEGGINYERMSFFPRMMLKMLKKFIEKKENKTPEDMGMLETFTASNDRSKKEYIMPLVEKVREVMK